MMLARMSVADIVAATGGKFLCGGETRFAGVSTDSRTIAGGELFIALRGERYDGHDFLAKALERASGALVDRPLPIETARAAGKTVILVPDTLQALHGLARLMRKRFSGRVVGIVGSNGKTTTKELSASVLSRRFRVHKTQGNLNNHIGMPLTITRCAEDAEVMVLEMGTNRPGDVTGLCDIALPEIGVITNIGQEHLEGFGSLDAVREGELEILPYLEKVAVNGDDQFLLEAVMPRFGGDLVTFGIESPEATVAAQDISYSEEATAFTLHAGDDAISVHSRLSGRLNVHNSLAAASVGLVMGLTLREIKDGLESFAGVALRFALEKHEGVTFLNDVYNANPSSMEGALGELLRFAKSGRHKRSLVVLGDMLELGGYAVAAHRNLGRRIAALPVDVFIGVGPMMSLAVSDSGGKGIALSTSDDAGRELSRLLQAGDIVLIKGSRGMQMEKVFAALKKRPDGPCADVSAGQGE